MSKPRVTAILDSLGRINRLVFPFSPGPLPMRIKLPPVERYLHGRLVLFGMELEGYGQPDVQEANQFSRILGGVYGPGYLHASGQLQARSWFNGATEIELVPLPSGNYAVTYADLTKLPALMQAEAKQQPAANK